MWGIVGSSSSQNQSRERGYAFDILVISGSDYRNAPWLLQVQISDGDTLPKFDQTMVALMQSYCLNEVSQLALMRWKTCGEVDQREQNGYQTTGVSMLDLDPARNRFTGQLQHVDLTKLIARQCQSMLNKRA